MGESKHPWLAPAQLKHEVFNNCSDEIQRLPESERAKVAKLLLALFLEFEKEDANG